MFLLFHSFVYYIRCIRLHAFIPTIIADIKWGRYKTIYVFTGVILRVPWAYHFVLIEQSFSVGHVILVASSASAVLQKPDTSFALSVRAIFVMALGAGSI
ncbi:hypothetical protein DFH07DRAFT_591957 [Mycena maculata]|uniref:Uncharacterized protein n=1 Tax=Mycena maculata TaxID=230809 RepID=A0AAD7N4Y7_9AGAR|nr:hypothetical protein DFH07DRAFT_591957 [Mycena maculata]